MTDTASTMTDETVRYSCCQQQICDPGHIEICRQSATIDFHQAIEIDACEGSAEPMSSHGPQTSTPGEGDLDDETLDGTRS